MIRKREIEIISEFVSGNKRGIVLDYGCGPGWLSKFLRGKHFRVVGMEINSPLLGHARHLSPLTDFIECDAHTLPFRNTIYDSVVGVSILHHLGMGDALRELRRTTKIGSSFMFMEPNPLNFLSALGRRFFPTEAHTTSEKPFLLRDLVESLRKFGFRITKTTYILFMSFPLARLYKIRNRRPSALTLKLIVLMEKSLEKMSIFRKLNSTFVVQGVSESQ